MCDVVSVPCDLFFVLLEKEDSTSQGGEDLSNFEYLQEVNLWMGAFLYVLLQRCGEKYMPNTMREYPPCWWMTSREFLVAVSILRSLV